LSTTSHDAPALPPGALNLNRFSLCNAICFQITLGSTLVLYAKSLGASATWLGVLAGLTPLLNLCQIPAAHWIPRFGYKRFVLAGWSARSALIFLVAALPLLSQVSPTVRLWILTALIFLFSLLRGISAGAWLPWITELIPEGLRGRFLSRDQAFQHTGSLAALLAAGWVLGTDPGPLRFALAFLLSATAAVVSLGFLARSPDVDAQDALRRSAQSVPWGAIVRHPPFARLLVHNLLFVFAVGGMGVFAVAWQKTFAGVPENRILLLSAPGFLAAMLALIPAGRAADRFGSKPLLRAGLALFALVAAGWFALATRIAPPSLWMIGTLNLLGGIGGAWFGLGNTRLMLGSMPPMGRNHFFALFTVLTSLGLAVAPVAWGGALDALADFRRPGPPEWNAYSLYFAAVTFLTVLCMVSTRILIEKAPSPAAGGPDGRIALGMKRLWRLWQR
jgi:MFS family permease